MRRSRGPLGIEGLFFLRPSCGSGGLSWGSRTSSSWGGVPLRLGSRGLQGSLGGLGSGFWGFFLVRLFIPLDRYSSNSENQKAMAYPSGRSWIRHLSEIRLFAPGRLLCVSRRISSWVVADCCWDLHPKPLTRSSWILSVPDVSMVVVKRAVVKQNQTSKWDVIM